MALTRKEILGSATLNELATKLRSEYGNDMQAIEVPTVLIDKIAQSVAEGGGGSEGGGGLASSENFIVVSAVGTPEENGQAFHEAYQAALATNPSLNNSINLLVSPGSYNLIPLEGDWGYELNSPYINIIGIGSPKSVQFTTLCYNPGNDGFAPCHFYNISTMDFPKPGYGGGFGPGPFNSGGYPFNIHPEAIFNTLVMDHCRLGSGSLNAVMLVGSFTNLTVCHGSFGVVPDAGVQNLISGTSNQGEKFVFPSTAPGTNFANNVSSTGGISLFGYYANIILVSPNDRFKIAPYAFGANAVGNVTIGAPAGSGQLATFININFLNEIAGGFAPSYMYAFGASGADLATYNGVVINSTATFKNCSVSSGFGIAYFSTGLGGTTVNQGRFENCSTTYGSFSSYGQTGGNVSEGIHINCTVVNGPGFGINQHSSDISSGTYINCHVGNGAGFGGTSSGYYAHCSAGTGFGEAPNNGGGSFSGTAKWCDYKAQPALTPAYTSSQNNGKVYMCTCNEGFEDPATNGGSGKIRLCINESNDTEQNLG